MIAASTIGGGNQYNGGFPNPGSGSYSSYWSNGGNIGSLGTPFDPGDGIATVNNAAGGWLRKTFAGTWSNGGNDNPSIFNGTSLQNTADTYGGFGQTSTGDYYCMQWTGYINPPTTGYYNFILESDDVAYFWIGTAALAPESYGPQCLTNNGNYTNTNSVALDSSLWYPIRMRFQEWSGAERCQLYFQKAGVADSLYAMDHWSANMAYNSSTATGYN